MTISPANTSVSQSTSELPENSLPSHLGGHLNKTHTDRGALKYLMDNFDIKSMIDIGCGPGGMVELARLRGIDAIGVDGDFTLEYSEELSLHIHIHDYSKPWKDGALYASREYDLAWSVEFLEHVEEKYMPNYMATFRSCKYALVTAAPPGYAGHHHVNCQDMKYWIDAFAKNGFAFSDLDTSLVRSCSTMQKPFMQTTGMFFKRID